jgi:eukaryotic-like serine/threonine-protein kinase
MALMADFGGRYRLVRRLGVGGMGEVWLAHDEELGDRLVAIKLMHSRMLGDPDDVARFQREMRLASRMQHPNIMTVFTTGSHDGAPFMVMEYLQGSDLGKLPSGFTADEVARIGRETCSALAYAHGLTPGVVHRDIKPGNLFICDSGQVKVTDFGIAKAVSGTKLSVTGTLIGTFPYMAPEQWLGEPTMFANDVWAVGCVLYELLAGTLPRSYATPTEYLAAAARREPVAPLPAAVPSWLSAAVLAMLQPHHADRPTAGQCVGLLSGPAISATPVPSRYAPLVAAGPGGTVTANGQWADPTAARSDRQPSTWPSPSLRPADGVAPPGPPPAGIEASRRARRRRRAAVYATAATAAAVVLAVALIVAHGIGHDPATAGSPPTSTTVSSTATESASTAATARSSASETAGAAKSPVGTTGTRKPTRPTTMTPSTSASSTSTSTPTSTSTSSTSAPGAGATPKAAVRWSQPTAVSQGVQLTSVSCASPQWCIATDNSGNVYENEGGSWTSSTSTANLLGAVSCPSTSFCETVGYDSSGGNGFTFDGNSWSAADTIDAGYKLHSVSCASASFCAAGASVNLFTYSDGTWSGPDSADPSDGNGTGITSLSCVSPSFCVAVDAIGNALTYSDGAWSSPDDIDGDTTLESVSCTSSSYCVAVDSAGNEFTYANGSWSGATDIDGGTSIKSVSCATSAFCVAVDSSGNALTFADGSWSPTDIDGGTALESVSCASLSYCVAVDTDGDALSMQ